MSRGCVFADSDEWLALHLADCSAKAKALYRDPAIRERMHERIDDHWYAYGDRMEARHRELMQAFVKAHDRKRPALLRFLFSRLWPLPRFTWRVQRIARRLQVVELAHEN